ncbi:MAG: hypothetical protein N2999_00080 [Proteobacteria bacterium]|nr:hypothetical protein [Pseudomonadota bacterium]
MKRLFLIILFLILSACSARELKELGALPKTEKTEYTETLKKYTRTFKLYDQFETKALVTATIFTPSFIRAYFTERERYSKTEDFRMFLDRENFLVNNYLRFFVSFYTPNEGLIDLEKSDTSWNIYLETSDGKRILPFSVKKAEEQRDILTYYFPYLDYWARPYYINFKKEHIDPSKDKVLTLNFVSVLGKITLDFSLP